MDDKTQKERLEQELRFLKESFEAEVISKEEYEKGRERIGRKLEETKSPAAEPANQGRKEGQEKERIEEEKIMPSAIQDEAKEQEYLETAQIKDENELPKEPVIEKPKAEVKEEKEKGKLFKYAVVFAVLILVVFFSYSFLKNKKEAGENKQVQTSFIAACYSNDDCRQEGKTGSCLSPGTKDAKCEFKDMPKINVVVLNSMKECFNCDARRVLSILEGWFGAIDAKEVDYSTEEGKKIAENYNAAVLPFYILDKEAAEMPSFEKFKQAFTEKGDGYALNEDAAGSAFYFKREAIPNKLDFFAKKGDSSSIKAENSLKEFLNAFEGIKFEKHLADDRLAQELNIKTFPTFLVNNRVKFGGVHPAETIKENFCKANNLEYCEKSLSKSLV